MNEKDTNKSSKTDWERVDALTDGQIDISDIPPLSDAFFAKATLQMPKERATVTVRIDSDVWAWYAAQGDDCERRMNMALRRYSEGQRA
uniref:BrnA antitoxin of type II toxin-antitoxin system n=1 Tax=Candidatus Kentrum sp. MB TaxID=2138164 RepID=A0A450X9X8_9GAMM|nr:MAG: BrnA antitoxin of type II toxin-antitoxin system [Candidatus Kentron sp. MB]VFK35455.1 MAG: BrnA antitoxin of type II toxin-antitoxin system [Candidatus Kentron sp. MB]VFK77399.1 MAG: BrnA antitoxin of type II toxin-antitoxin system [Candidatus Kentron sp. MB]